MQTTEQQKGMFTLSIDLELAWGICDERIRRNTSQAIAHERSIIQGLISILSTYQISATWAVVGHLLLDRCERQDGNYHPEFPRRVLRNSDRDWLFQHPDTHDEIWYGRDIVSSIQRMSPPQEIGSHSFFHIPFGNPAVNPEAVAKDVAMVRVAHEQLGQPVRSFVYPRNSIGHRATLLANGITAYRGNPRRWFDFIRWVPLWRALYFIGFLLRITPPTARAHKDSSGLVNIPESLLLLLGRNGIRKLLPASALVSMAKRGIDRAVDRKEVFHLWFHPINFIENEEVQFRSLKAIVSHVAELRDRGQIDVRTMNEIARQLAKHKDAHE